MEYFVTKYDVSCQNSADCVVLDDSIMVKGSLATAGSKMLENFISPIDATVVSKLADAGVPIAGKTVMDEFGASGIFLEQGVCATKRAVISGQQATVSGAVSAVANGDVPFALCNDYTGAVSLEAAEQGLYYIHPTYGTVSRYGLIPAVASMDQIGVVCKSIRDGERLLSIIAGYDEKDGVMSPTGKPNPQKRDNLRIGVPDNLSTESRNALEIAGLSNGFELVYFELEYFDIYNQIMQILCCAELSNNISRYDGIKFGYRTKEYSGLQELYTKSRTEGFGFDTKLSATIGAMVLSHDHYTKSYDKAMRTRRMIKSSLDFKKYEAIVVPTPCLARLCGLPAITMPHKDNALTLIAAAGNEDILMTIVGSGK